MAVVLYHTQIMAEVKITAYLLSLPAFFWIAGVFSRTDRSVSDFAAKNSLRLLIPYLIFGLITWVAWLLIGRKYGDGVDAGIAWWEPLWSMAIGDLEGMVHNRPLWFLCCLVSLEWIYYGISKIAQRGIRWIVIGVLSITGFILSQLALVLPWEIHAALVVLPIYAIGAESREWYIHSIPSWRTIVLIGILIVSIGCVWIGYRYNPMVKISAGHIGNALFYVQSIGTIGVWTSLSILLHRLCKRIRLMPYIGQNTILILCCHIPLFSMIKGIALICHASLDIFTTTAGALLLWISTFIILVPVSYLVNRYLPWIVGKGIKVR